MAILEVTQGTSFDDYLATPAREENLDLKSIVGATVQFLLDPDLDHSFIAPDDANSLAGVASISLSVIQINALQAITYPYTIRITFLDATVIDVETGALRISTAEGWQGSPNPTPTENAKELHDADPAAGGDLGSEYYISSTRKDAQGLITLVGIEGASQLANIVALGLNLGDNIGDPSAFSMVLEPETLNAVISPAVTGIDYEKWRIQDVDDAVPLIDAAGWVPGSIPTLYAVDTSWTAATLLARTYRLFVATALAVTEITPPQTVTPVTTRTVPQTPDDVNFPAIPNVVAGNPITSNTVKILGLLAPTAISISGGTNAKYSKNGGTFTNVAGVIELNDTIALQQDASGSDDTPTTITVSLGLRDEDWTVTTAATGVTAGVISIVAASYSGAEDSTIDITLAVTGKEGSVTMGCRVSTYFVQDYHTAEPGVNFVGISGEPVEWVDADATNKTVTITNVDKDMSLDIVGELIIDSGSEFGGATIDGSLDATLFTVTATGSGEGSYVQEDISGDKIVHVNFREALDDAGGARAFITERNGIGWGDIAENGDSLQSTPSSYSSPPNPGYSTASGELYFWVDFKVTGDHYLWLDCAAIDGDGNSCYIGVDGQEDGDAYDAMDLTNTYSWSDDNGTSQKWNIPTVGLHKISMWGREDRFKATALIMTTNAAYAVPGTPPATSTWSGSSSGIDPNNPDLPLGPPLIIDDKTPDPFPFGEKIDQLLSATNIESDAQPIIGINVVTEVAITSDPSGTAEYKIDSGSWVTAAGTLSAGSTVTVRLDASALNDTAVTMNLTIGTVTYSFTVITKAAGFIVLLPRTTTINVTTDDFVIDDDDVTVPAGSGPAVAIAAGVDNTTVFNCRLNAEGDHAIKAESDIGALTVDHSEITARYQGIRVKGASAFTVTYCNLENCETHIALYATGWGNVDISDNYFKNASLSATPGRGGNCVQFQWVTGPDIVLARNICINEFGESNPEDIFSMYKSSGTVASPIHLLDNKIRGGGPSLSGSALQLGDRYGANYLAEGNIIYNGPQTGIGISGDANIVVRNNDIFNDAMLDHQNTGIVTGYTRWQTALACAIDPTGSLCEPRIIASPTGIVVELNKVHFWQSPLFGSSIWELQPFFKVPIDFTPTPAGWSTNLFDTDASQLSGLTSDIWDTAWDIRPQVLTTP